MHVRTCVWFLTGRVWRAGTSNKIMCKFNTPLIFSYLLHQYFSVKEMHALHRKLRYIVLSNMLYIYIILFFEMWFDFLAILFDNYTYWSKPQNSIVYTTQTMGDMLRLNLKIHHWRQTNVGNSSIHALKGQVIIIIITTILQYSDMTAMVYTLWGYSMLTCYDWPIMHGNSYYNWFHGIDLYSSYVTKQQKKYWL